MVVENQYPTRSETPSVFGCGYAALCENNLIQIAAASNRAGKNQESEGRAPGHVLYPPMSVLQIRSS
ncbi:MAG: hypothetical protein ACK5AZ_26220, partial [Bryobacteraceae bacterium]